MCLRTNSKNDVGKAKGKMMTQCDDTRQMEESSRHEHDDDQGAKTWKSLKEEA